MHGTIALQRVIEAAIGAFRDFLLFDYAVLILAFVVLFKFTDALSGAMTAPFVIDLGFSRNEYAAIIKGVGLAATLLGGFAGGFVARAYPLATSLWIGGLLQASANLAFSWQAIVGHDIAWLTFAIIAENFTSAIGTVIYVAYLSALCRNPLHTATQYALLTALAAVGRTYLSATAGFIAAACGLGRVLCDLRRRRHSEPRAARSAPARRAFQDAGPRRRLHVVRDVRIRTGPAFRCSCGLTALVRLFKTACGCASRRRACPRRDSRVRRRRERRGRAASPSTPAPARRSVM